MRDPRRVYGLALLAVILLLTATGAVPAIRLHRSAPAAATAGAALTAQGREATFTFGPEVAPLDRQAILTAVAAARPEARRLIDLVDGLVTVHVGPTGASAVGLTSAGPKGYVVTVDLARVSQRYAQRGIDRVVLHELGHVIDFALVPDDLLARLDASVPRGWGCEAGKLGACAAPEERFAETFAKWATGDIGADLYIGYKVPPPSVSLETWGRPLTRLAGAVSGP